MIQNIYIFLLSATITFTISFSYCQNFQVGINGSLNNTWLLKDTLLNNQFTFGYSKGLMVNVYFDSNKNLNSYEHGVSLGMLLANHNQNYRGNVGYGTGFSPDSVAVVTRNVKLKLIEIPLLFRLSQEEAAYFEVGPQLSVLQSASESYTDDFYPDKNYTDKNVKDNYEPIGISAIVGIGKNINPTEHLYITIGIRAMYGITNISKINKQQAIHPLSINIMAGIYYSLI